VYSLSAAERPIVTIGLCVRNAEKTIGEAVAGIANQDLPHELMEVIVVDGRSQDKTMLIIKERLKRTDMKTSFFSENVGLGFARQVVVDNAKADYIVWVDGDIVLPSDHIRRQVDFMEQHPSVGVAVGSFGVLAEDNWVATLENMGYVIDSFRHHGRATSRLIGTEGAIFRVSAIRQVGGFSTEIKGAQEDLDATYRIRAAGWRFYVTDAVLYERQRSTWRELWRQHSWYGYGLHFVQHKNKDQNLIRDKNVDRIIFSLEAYRLTRRKIVFLMPLNFVFKKTALLLGFLMAHMNGYGHSISRSDLARDL